MALVTTCNHCGKRVDESGGKFALIEVRVAQGGGVTAHFHNSEEQPCFNEVYQAIKSSSDYPQDYPDGLAVQVSSSRDEPSE